jgi:hypothetical protein
MARVILTGMRRSTSRGTSAPNSFKSILAYFVVLELGGNNGRGSFEAIRVPC